MSCLCLIIYQDITLLFILYINNCYAKTINIFLVWTPVIYLNSGESSKGHVDKRNNYRKYNNQYLI